MMSSSLEPFSTLFPEVPMKEPDWLVTAMLIVSVWVRPPASVTVTTTSCEVAAS